MLPQCFFVNWYVGKNKPSPQKNTNTFTIFEKYKTTSGTPAHCKNTKGKPCPGGGGE